MSDTQDRGHEFLMDISLRLTVELGRTKLLGKELLAMKEGTVLELDKLAGEPLDIYVNQRLIAKGETVMVGDKYGIKLTEVVSESDRLEKMTGE